MRKNRKKDIVRVHHKVVEGWWDLDVIPQKLLLAATMYYNENENVVKVYTHRIERNGWHRYYKLECRT